MNNDEKVSGTLQLIFNGNISWRDQFSTVNPRIVSWKEDASKFHPFPLMKTKFLHDTSHEDLQEMYKILLGNDGNTQDIVVPKTYLQAISMGYMAKYMI